MKPYAPDIGNPLPGWTGGGGRNNGGNNGGGQGGGRGPMMPAFQPGQLNALANQLNMGFGGGVKDWKADLRNTYDPTSMRGFNFGGGHGGGNGNRGGGGNNGGGNSPNGSGQDHNNGGFTPSNPRSMAMPMGGGLLGPQMMQQPRQSGLLGDVPPEVLAFLSSPVRR